MPVDFGALVLKPGLDAFGEPVTFQPAAGGVIVTSDASWPDFELRGAIANLGRGVFDQGNRDIEQRPGEAPTTTEIPTLGIRLSEFATLPLQSDQLFIESVASTYVVMEVLFDSHGGARLKLQLVS